MASTSSSSSSCSSEQERRLRFECDKLPFGAALAAPPLVVALRWLTLEIFDAVDGLAKIFPGKPFVPLTLPTAAYLVSEVLDGVKSYLREKPEADFAGFRGYGDRSRKMHECIDELMAMYQMYVPFSGDMLAGRERGERINKKDPRLYFAARPVVVVTNPQAPSCFAPKYDLEIHVLLFVAYLVLDCTNDNAVAAMIGKRLTNGIYNFASYSEKAARKRLERIGKGDLAEMPPDVGMNSLTDLVQALAGQMLSPLAVRECIWRLFIAYDSRLTYAPYSAKAQGGVPEMADFSMVGFLEDVQLRRVYEMLTKLDISNVPVVTAETLTHVYKLPSISHLSCRIAEFEETVPGLPRSQFGEWSKKRKRQLEEADYSSSGVVVLVVPTHLSPKQQQQQQQPSQDDQQQQQRKGALCVGYEAVPGLAELAASGWEFSPKNFVIATSVAVRTYLLDKLRSKNGVLKRGESMILLHEYAQKVVLSLDGKTPLFGLSPDEEAAVQPWVLLAVVFMASYEGARGLFVCMETLCPVIERHAVRNTGHKSKKDRVIPNTPFFLPPVFMQEVAWLCGVDIPSVHERMSVGYAVHRQRWSGLLPAQKAVVLSEILVSHMTGFRTLANYLQKTNRLFPAPLVSMVLFVADEIDLALRQKNVLRLLHYFFNPMALTLAGFSLASNGLAAAAAAAAAPPPPSFSPGGAAVVFDQTPEAKPVMTLDEFSARMQEVEKTANSAPEVLLENTKFFVDEMVASTAMDRGVLGVLCGRMRRFLSPLVVRIAKLSCEANLTSQFDDVCQEDFVLGEEDSVAAEELKQIADNPSITSDRRKLMMALSYSNNLHHIQEMMMTTTMI